MIKKIEILGIEIDNYTVREAILQVEGYLNEADNIGMHTIESVSMEMLVKAKEDEVLKECIENLDLAIVNDKEILIAAGVNSPQRLHETIEQQFLEEFMKRIIRNGKTVYLIGTTIQQTEQLEHYLKTDYERLKIVGKFAIADCAGDYDDGVNDINIASPDVIFSVLPTPEQEYFLMESKSKMNVGIWYGLGNNYAKKRGFSYVKSRIRKLMHKTMMNNMLSQYDEENEVK